MNENKKEQPAGTGYSKKIDKGTLSAKKIRVINLGNSHCNQS